MANVSLAPDWGQHFHDDNGDPASGWRVYVFESNTQDYKESYSDSNGTILHTAPYITLNARGEYPGEGLYLIEGEAYTLELRDQDNVPVRTVNNIIGGASGGSGGATITTWDDVENDIVNLMSGASYTSPYDISSGTYRIIVSYLSISGSVTDPRGCVTTEFTLADLSTSTPWQGREITWGSSVLTPFWIRKSGNNIIFNNASSGNPSEYKYKIQKKITQAVPSGGGSGGDITLPAQTVLGNISAGSTTAYAVEIESDLASGDALKIPNVGAVRDALDDYLPNSGDNTYSGNLDVDGSLTVNGEEIDKKTVKVSDNDTTEGYLEDKIVGAGDATVTTISEGGNEQVQIEVNIPEESNTVKVSGNDTTADYLQQKITASGAATVEIDNEGGDEILRINVEEQTGDNKVLVNDADSVAAYLDAKVIEGYGISVDVVAGAEGDALQISLDSGQVSDSFRYYSADTWIFNEELFVDGGDTYYGPSNYSSSGSYTDSPNFDPDTVSYTAPEDGAYYFSVTGALVTPVSTATQPPSLVELGFYQTYPGGTLFRRRYSTIINPSPDEYGRVQYAATAVLNLSANEKVFFGTRSADPGVEDVRATFTFSGFKIVAQTGSSIGGSGTPLTIPLWTPDGLTLGDSAMTDDGTTITATDRVMDVTDGSTYQVKLNPASPSVQISKNWGVSGSQEYTFIDSDSIGMYTDAGGGLYRALNLDNTTNQRLYMTDEDGNYLNVSATEVVLNPNGSDALYDASSEAGVGTSVYVAGSSGAITNAIYDLASSGGSNTSYWARSGGPITPQTIYIRQNDGEGIFELRNMAINFVDDDNNSLTVPRYASEPAAPPYGDGALYYNTTTDMLYVYATGAWTPIVMGVSDVDAWNTVKDGASVDSITYDGGGVFTVHTNGADQMAIGDATNGLKYDAIGWDDTNKVLALGPRDANTKSAQINFPSYSDDIILIKGGNESTSSKLEFIIADDGLSQDLFRFAHVDTGGTERECLRMGVDSPDASAEPFAVFSGIFGATDGTYYVGFRSAATLAATTIWTLPEEDGTVGQVLTTDGNGILSWEDGGSGGSDQDVLDLQAGIILETQTITLVEDGGSWYAEMEQEGGGDLTVDIAGTKYTIDCTTGSGTSGKARSTTALTLGSATSPSIQYVYIKLNGSTPEVRVGSTIDRTGPFAHAGVYELLDDTYTTANGALYYQRFNDSSNHGTEGRGLLSETAERVRVFGPQIFRGVEATTIITTNASALDGLHINTSAGIVYQLHQQTVTAETPVSEYIVVNHPTTPFTTVSNLNELTVDANGDALYTNGKYFGMTFAVSVSSEGQDMRVYVWLPTGNYANIDNAINDLYGYADITASIEMQSSITRLGRIVIGYTNVNGGTFTNALGGVLAQDQRNYPIGTTGGGGVGGSDYTKYPFIPQTTAPTPVEEGTTYYNANTHNLVVQVNGVNLDVGRENWVRGYNNTGSTITNGTVVYLNNGVAEGSEYVADIELANAGSKVTCTFVGVATEDIPTGSYGEVTVAGMVNDMDTSSWTNGDILYVSTTDGVLTNSAPAFPNFECKVGKVLNVSATDGVVFVAPDVDPPQGSGGIVQAGIETFPICDITDLYTNSVSNTQAWTISTLIIPTANIQVNYMSCFVTQIGTNYGYRMGIYSPGSASDTLLGQTVYSTSAFTTGINTLAMSSPVALMANTPYLLALQVSSNGTIFGWRDGNQGNGGIQTNRPNHMATFDFANNPNPSGGMESPGTRSSSTNRIWLACS